MNDSTIAGHFTSPPYIFLELEQPGFRQVLTGDEAFGGAFTFIVGSVTRSLHDDRSDLYAAFLDALEAAVTFIRENPQETASMLAGIYSIPPERVLAYLQHPDMEFSTDITGVMPFARFMHANGYLDRLPETLGEVVWDTP